MTYEAVLFGVKLLCAAGSLFLLGVIVGMQRKP